MQTVLTRNDDSVKGSTQYIAPNKAYLTYEMQSQASLLFNPLIFVSWART